MEEVVITRVGNTGVGCAARPSVYRPRPVILEPERALLVCLFLPSKKSRGEVMKTTNQPTHDALLAEIKAAGLRRGTATLNHLWKLYLRFCELRRMGVHARLVGHLRQARLIIDGGRRPRRQTATRRKAQALSMRLVVAGRRDDAS